MGLTICLGVLDVVGLTADRVAEELGCVGSAETSLTLLDSIGDPYGMDYISIGQLGRFLVVQDVECAMTGAEEPYRRLAARGRALVLSLSENYAGANGWVLIEDAAVIEFQEEEDMRRTPGPRHPADRVAQAFRAFAELELRSGDVMSVPMRAWPRSQRVRHL